MSLIEESFMNRTPILRKRLVVAVSCVALLAACGLASAQTTAIDPNLDRRALIDDGASPDLFLLQTGDVIGYLDPCG